MKWVPWAAKALAHPSLLPIALATFVSVAGPGGIAEFGRSVPTGSIVAVAPETPLVLANEPRPAPLGRVAHEQTPASVGPVIAAERTPLATEEVIDPSHELTGTDEVSMPSDDHGQTAPNSITVEVPTEDGDEGTVADECEVQGNGHDKHDVEPGHDKNNDGIDDRCEPDEGGDEGTADDQCDVPGNGHDDHPVEPGHDKDGDGIDNRCQQNDDGENNDAHDGNNGRKDDG